MTYLGSSVDSPGLFGYPNGRCWIGLADWAVLLVRVGLAHEVGRPSGLGYPMGWVILEGRIFPAGRDILVGWVRKWS